MGERSGSEPRAAAVPIKSEICQRADTVTSPLLCSLKPGPKKKELPGHDLMIGGAVVEVGGICVVCFGKHGIAVDVLKENVFESPR